MHRAAVLFVMAGLAAAPAAAQNRSRNGDRAQGIPPGHLPPPGECRVWYDDRPAGHQPPPTDCHEAERVAARDRDTRVIYGGERDRRDDGRWERDDDRRDRGRAVPRRNPSDYPYPDRRYPDRYPSRDRYPYPDDRYGYPERYPRDGGRYGYSNVPFDNGYRDGYEKGREDARDRDSYDPVRHSRYRSADRGYNRRYGSREEYKDIYRDGFRAGYDEGYRDNGGYRRERGRSGIRLPWPF